MSLHKYLHNRFDIFAIVKRCQAKCPSLRPNHESAEDIITLLVKFYPSY